MSDDKKDIKKLEEHFDGIIEHDHPLPNWWVATFVITVVFSIFYYGYYELLDGPTLDQELSVKMAEIEQQQKDSVGKAFDNLDQDVLKQEFIDKGKVVFAEKCFMCHGQQGQGLIGPNLTDNFWIHGNTSQNILHVIQKGVPEKGMVPWEAVLSAEEQIATVAFIKSLKGTNPPTPKAAEGTEYKD